jgi:hypothetical protein
VIFGTGQRFRRDSAVMAAIWPFVVGKHTLPRMDKPMHLSFMAWLLLAAVASGAWVLNAIVEGSSTFAIIVGPLLILLWVAAVLVIDRWVAGSANQPE